VTRIPRGLRVVLWPLSLIYGAGAILKAWLYKRGVFERKRLGRPVISVGNLTVGGTGKTPMVIWLAERLIAKGKRVGVLSRGYRGDTGTSDEIELMKSRLAGHVVFGVGADRYEEGAKLEDAVDVFLLDDGFQHLKLARDLDIVLVDSTRPLRKEFVLPAGRMREPMSALHRAGMVVFTRADQSFLTTRTIQEFPQFAIYPATMTLLGFRRVGANEELKAMASGRAFAFCGVGNPDAFFGDLERWGVTLVGRRVFRDHHRYSSRELARIEKEAKAAGAVVLVTTEKDAKNLPANPFEKIRLEIAVAEMRVPDEGKFLSEVWERARLGTGAAA
jgi:tetraacyldisaccharide 4'-kinase